MKQKFFSTVVADQSVDVAYTQWGDPENFPVICVHGLARNARDFDNLAKKLSQKFCVYCLDMVGRGKSSWLKDPNHYDVEIYIQHVLDFAKYKNISSCHWVGTSMGGIMAMVLGAIEDSFIQKIVINDIGWRVPKEALQDIKNYLDKNFQFESEQAYFDYIKSTYINFGKLKDEDWWHYVQHGLKEKGDHFVLHYDPTILNKFFELAEEDWLLHEFWEQVNVPVLLIRGKYSKVLPEDVFQDMLRHDHVTGIQYDDCGHAPSLMTDLQTEQVYSWLVL